MSDVIFKIGDKVKFKANPEPQLTVHGFTKTGTDKDYDPDAIKFRTPSFLDHEHDFQELRFVICSYYNHTNGSFQKVTLGFDEIEKV